MTRLAGAAARPAGIRVRIGPALKSSMPDASAQRADEGVFLSNHNI